MSIKPSYDLVIVIFACDTIEKYLHQVLKIEDTWAKDVYSRPNIKLLFFFGEDEVLIKDNYIHLKGVRNDYLSASYKQWYGLKYAYENYDAKFVITAGTDTFFNIPKLMTLLSNFKSNATSIIGFKPQHSWRKVTGSKLHYLDGGIGIILTSSALKVLYPKFCNVNAFMTHWLTHSRKNSSCICHTSCDLALVYYYVKLCNPYAFSLSSIFCTDNNIKPNENTIFMHPINLINFDKYYNILLENNHFIDSPIPKDSIKVVDLHFKN